MDPASVRRRPSVHIFKHLLLSNSLANQSQTFDNLLLQNRMSYDLETWPVASGTQALQILYKW